MLSESLFPHLQLEDKNICPTYLMDRESSVEIYVKPPKKTVKHKYTVLLLIFSDKFNLVYYDIRSYNSLLFHFINY